MGKIFTWPAIQSGNIPTLEDFTLVDEMLRRDLGHERAISDSIVCGSVVRRDHNIRSDIDCAVFYPHAQSRQAFAAMQHLSARANQHHVPLTFIPCDTEVMKTRLHHFGPDFIKHLRSSARQGGLIKGDPFRHIAASISQEQEFESYLRVKAYTLQEGWAEFPVLSEERQAAFLKKALEAPLHIARKLLRLHGYLQENDSKAQVRKQYAISMPQQAVEMLGRILHLDVEYTRELDRQLQEPSLEDYETFLTYLAEEVPNILEFLRWNIQFVVKEARQ